MRLKMAMSMDMPKRKGNWIKGKGGKEEQEKATADYGKQISISWHKDNSLLFSILFIL